MSFLVDSCVWSLALRRALSTTTRETELLRNAIDDGSDVWTTGTILQEVLQGFHDAPRRDDLEKRMRSFSLLPLGRPVFLLAAQVHDVCRARGLQVGTVDAQVAAAALSYDLPLLTTDVDFRGIARHFPLRLA